MVPEVVWFMHLAWMHLGIPDLEIYAHTLVAIGKIRCHWGDLLNVIHV